MIRCPHCGFEDFEIYYRPDWRERAIARTHPEAFKGREFWQCRRCKKSVYVGEKYGNKKYKQY